MKLWLSVLSVVLATVCGDLCSAAAGTVRPVYPGKTWARKTPAQVGLNADKLAAMSRFAGGFGCVVRHGYLVYTWGDASRRKDVASAAKPVYTHFLLKAIEDGKLKGVDEPVVKVEPRLGRINKKLGYKDRQITWRHLCNQISCYGVQERPGQAYDYSDYNIALFFDCVFLPGIGEYACPRPQAAPDAKYGLLRRCPVFLSSHFNHFALG